MDGNSIATPVDDGGAGPHHEHNQGEATLSMLSLLIICAALVSGQPSTQIIGQRLVSAKFVGVDGPVSISVDVAPPDAADVTLVWPFGHAKVRAWMPTADGYPAFDPADLARQCGRAVVCNGYLYACVPPQPWQCTSAAPHTTFVCATAWSSASCIDGTGAPITAAVFSQKGSIEWAANGATIVLRSPPNLMQPIMYCWFLFFALMALMADAPARRITKLDLATSAGGGLIVIQYLTPLTPSVLARYEWTTYAVYGTAAAIGVASLYGALRSRHKTVGEVSCLCALGVLYPETLVGRQPVMLISTVCALLVCALAGGRREILAAPGVVWATGVIIFPMLTESLIHTALPELAVLSALITGTVTMIAYIAAG